MKWVQDKTGRFSERPHYEPEELDLECEQIVGGFLKNRYGKIQYPLSTGDLILMLEKETDSVDAYIHFGDEDIWGETAFFPGKKPRVKISSLLSQDDRYENPYRTTITHEFSHVRFHGFLFELKSKGENLFTGEGLQLVAGQSSVCRRFHIQSLMDYDWMEWQAGYCSGALLMPKSGVHRLICELRERWGFVTEAIETGTLQGQVLISGVSETFRVSKDAARVRLVKLGYLVEGRSRLESSRV